MRRPAILVVIALLLAVPASADPGDGGPFRRTTPRAEVIRAGEWTFLGIPGGRAWGLESALRPLDVREVFLRVAYYARGDARSRQLAIADSAAVSVVAGGSGTAVTVRLDPPLGAVAYRVRLLGRLFGRDLRTAAGAIRARWDDPGAADGGPPALTRLLQEPP